MSQPSSEPPNGQPSDDSTPTPAGRLRLDPEALHGAAVHLQRSAEEYDASGSSAPPAGTGAAAPLVALALGAHLEAATLVVSEARVLSRATRMTAKDLEITDAQAALDLFDVGIAS